MESFEDIRKDNVSASTDLPQLESVAVLVNQKKTLLESKRGIEYFTPDVEKLESESQNNAQWVLCEICCSRGLLADGMLCDHKYCTACLGIYMKTRIANSACEIYCPWPGCRYKFPAWQIMKRLDTETKEQYLNLTLRKALAQSRETHYCPGTNCGFALFVDPTYVAACGPVIKCRDPRCEVEFCYHCKKLWHPTRLCASVQAKFPGMKRCPRCGIFIVKRNDGSCNQMQCTACDHEFCWLCLENFTSSHFPFSCPAFGKMAYSRKRRMWNRIVFGVTLPLTVPVTVAVVSGVVAANVAFLAAAGSLSSPFILAKRLNKYLKTKKISSNKRKAALAGGTGLAVLALPALAPWGIYRTVRWVSGQVLDALDGLNEFNFEELGELQTRSLSEARIESQFRDRSWSVPILDGGEDSWDMFTGLTDVEHIIESDGDKITERTPAEPSGSVKQDRIVTVEAKDIRNESYCDDEFVVAWRKTGI